ncbi:MAG: DUF2911 domain-containing protein [Planctomycetes bacterium]|nr:DUF2911 domain-containing protein [Planctomycetota bacterium]
MKQLVLTLALAAGLTLPVAAQSMGSVNANAPKVTTAIEFADGAKLTVTYKALNFGQGSWLERAKSERARNMYNQNAKENPCGSVSVSKDMVVAGTQIAAGEYGLHFMFGDDGTPMAMLSTTDKEGNAQMQQFPLKLEAMESHSQRLAISISAGEKDGTCVIALQFGKLGMKCTGTTAAAGGEKGDGKGADQGKEKVSDK